MLGLTLVPPFSPVEPVTEILHGVPVTDPYRWLEDQDSPHTRKWLEEQGFSIALPFPVKPQTPLSRAGKHNEL